MVPPDNLLALHCSVEFLIETGKIATRKTIQIPTAISFFKLPDQPGHHGKFMLPLDRSGTVINPRNFQIIEYQTRRKTELPHFLSHIAYALTFEEAESELP